MTIEIVSGKSYTVEEFLEFVTNSDRRYELINGEILEMASPSARHGKIISKLVYNLLNQIESSKAGVLFTGAAYLPDPAGPNYFVPDAAYYVAGRLPDDFDGPLTIAPDLAIEVNSPSDTVERIYSKIESYQKAGVRLIWSIYMLGKFILVYRLNDPDIKLLNLKDALEGEDVIPGFKLPVRALFE